MRSFWFTEHSGEANLEETGSSQWNGKDGAVTARGVTCCRSASAEGRVRDWWQRGTANSRECVCLPKGVLLPPLSCVQPLALNIPQKHIWNMWSSGFYPDWSPARCLIWGNPLKVVLFVCLFVFPISNLYTSLFELKLTTFAEK